MNPELIEGKLTQAVQIFTYINMKLPKGDFDSAISMAQKLVPIFTQIRMSDLIQGANTLLELLRQGDYKASSELVGVMSEEVI